MAKRKTETEPDNEAAEAVTVEVEAAAPVEAAPEPAQVIPLVQPAVAAEATEPAEATESPTKTFRVWKSSGPDVPGQTELTVSATCGLDAKQQWFWTHNVRDSYNYRLRYEMIE